MWGRYRTSIPPPTMSYRDAANTQALSNNACILVDEFNILSLVVTIHTTCFNTHKLCIHPWTVSNTDNVNILCKYLMYIMTDYIDWYWQKTYLTSRQRWQTLAWLRWRGPAATVNYRPVLSSERALKITNSNCLKENLKDKEQLVAGPRWASDTKKDWPTDCRP
jgi:hypothetical protein